MTWKYVRGSNNQIVVRTLPDGSTESCLVSVIQDWIGSGNTPEPAAVVWPAATTPLKLKQAALVEARPALLQDEIFIDDTITIGEWQ